MYRLFLSNDLHDEAPTQDVFETEQEAKMACSEENLSSERCFQTTKYTVKEENTSFYEVEFGRKDMPHDTDSICILGVREPSISEAEEFCKEDMEWFGYDKVKKVTPLSISDAKRFFDTEDNHLWPVFGKEN